MASTLGLVLNFLIFPGLLFTAIVGLLTQWVDRKVSARVQWRVGPPWYQPFADILKLLGKEIVIPEGAKRTGFLLAPLAGLAAVGVVSTMLWLANISDAGFVGDTFALPTAVRVTRPRRPPADARGARPRHPGGARSETRHRAAAAERRVSSTTAVR